MLYASYTILLGVVGCGPVVWVQKRLTESLSSGVGLSSVLGGNLGPLPLFCYNSAVLSSGLVVGQVFS